ncbi:Gfo/Idh/MocA family protein [Chloroflexota bacterium]
MRLGMIGCGAITKGQHLPAAASNEHTEIAALVDSHLPNAQQLADDFELSAIVAADYKEIIDKIDIAVVAVPHHLHAPIALDLLKHGIHVLVEKPMAITAHDCGQMIQAAKTAPGGPVVLAVGHIRRFFRNSLYVKEILERGFLGPIKSFDCREGTTSVWPRRSSTSFRYDKKLAGGGVLVDIGVHVLDLLLWWFGDYGCSLDGKPALRYFDDDMGGVEANCLLEIEMHPAASTDTNPAGAGDRDMILTPAVSGTVELSRTRDLRNSWIICGERGTLEVSTGPNSLIHLQLDGQQTALTGSATRNRTADCRHVDVFARQYEDFLRAVTEHGKPLIPGEVGRRVVELIETCYAHKQPLQQPWLLLAPPMDGALEGKPS